MFLNVTSKFLNNFINLQTNRGNSITFNITCTTKLTTKTQRHEPSSESVPYLTAVKVFGTRFHPTTRFGSAIQKAYYSH